jgi:hypothetical protein
MGPGNCPGLNVLMFLDKLPVTRTPARRTKMVNARGRGMGGGGGQGGGAGQGGGSGRGGGRGGGFRPGPGGFCICPSCSHQVPHQQGVPCFEMKCEKCGTAMIRER